MNRLSPLCIFLIATLTSLMSAACGPAEEPHQDLPVVIIDDPDLAPDMTTSDMATPDMRQELDTPADMVLDPADMTTPDMADMTEPDMTPDMMPSPPACDETSCDIITWTQGPMLPSGRDHHMTFLAHDEQGRGMLFVAGGFLQGNPPTFINEVLGAPIAEDGSLGPWQAQPSLPNNLAGAPVIRSPHGTVILPGGRITRDNGQLALTNQILITTPTPDGLSGEWREDEERFPVNRFHHASAQSETIVYLSGGLELNDATDTIHMARFDATGGLEGVMQTRNLPEPLTHHASFYHDGALYIVGGMANGLTNPVPRAEVWRAVADATTGDLGEWEAQPALPFTVMTHAVTLYEGYVYLFGGLKDTRIGFSADVVRAPLMEGGIGAWEVLPMALMPRTTGHTHHVPIWRDHVYIVGGGQRLTLTPQVDVGTLNAMR